MPFITQGKTNLTYILIVVVLAVIVGGGILGYQYLEIQKVTLKTPETLLVSLGEEFILHKNQSAKIKNESLEIKITEFYNSPCPKDVQCVWSGIGIAFEYSKNGELERRTWGINLAEAFGYRTTIIDTDYETYAKLRVDKISE